MMWKGYKFTHTLQLNVLKKNTFFSFFETDLLFLTGELIKSFQELLHVSCSFPHHATTSTFWAIICGLWTA